MPRRSALLSIPFVSLYVAAIGAVALSWGRQRWSAAAWYPPTVGFVAAMAIIPLRHMLTRSLPGHSASDWWRIVFFSFAALLPLVGIPFLIHDSPLLTCGLLGMALLFTWGALGTAFQWPGFRPPLEDNQCRRCRYDLTGNTSGVCPECGTTILGRPDADSP